MTGPEREVRCDLAITAWTEVTLAVHVAAARPAADLPDEVVLVTHDARPGEPIPVVAEDGAPDASAAVLTVPAAHGGRVHVVTVPPGNVQLTYTATVLPGVETAPGPSVPPVALPWQDRLTYLRPSRYCPTDRMAGWARQTFEHVHGDRARVEAIAGWIADRIDYNIGGTAPTDDAAVTLLSGQGVCRDFAHVAVTACRSLDIPARTVAVYAPGLAPMDFHAVFEAWVEGAWHVFDATRLAPRTALVRIATGRDAADTAFLTVIDGFADLQWTQVTAITRGDLPNDDLSTLVTLP